MNTLGTSLFIFSGTAILFALLSSWMALGLRTQYQLLQSVSLAWLSRKTKPWNSIYLSFLFSIISPVDRLFKRVLGLDSYALHALRDKGTLLGGRALLANFLIVSALIFLLIFLLMKGDLSNRYVVSHTADNLALFYRFTALWAGSSGSLLLWYWLLSLFSVLLLFQVKVLRFRPNAKQLSHKGSDFQARQKALIVWLLCIVQSLFIFLPLFFSNAQPYLSYATSMQAGRGINPLLLHWAMIIHPPILYLGYVSSAIPFVILIASLIAGPISKRTFRLLRFWCLFSWFFLGTGILLGSKWAYEELGWGGYWAWDPVENASLMPWLLLTAFLHSIIVQERRGMLRFWNALLVLLIYHMCLLGTWITRSGVLEGPHSFSSSSLGLPMIIFILASFVFFSRFLFLFRKHLKPTRTMEALSSKEGTLLLNNFLMLLAMFLILLGVFSPLLPLDCTLENASLQCFQVEWKQATYNRLLIPVGLSALFLMGASPLLPWRIGMRRKYLRQFRIPLLTGLLGAIGFSLSLPLLFIASEYTPVSIWGNPKIASFLAILAFGIAIFVISGIIQEYWQGISGLRKRAQKNALRALAPVNKANLTQHISSTKDSKITSTLSKQGRLSLLYAAWLLFSANRTRYGGYLVHLAIVFLFIGYAGSAFKKTSKLEFYYNKVPLTHLLDSRRLQNQHLDRGAGQAPSKRPLQAIPGKQSLPQSVASTAVVYYSGDLAYIDDYQIQAQELIFRPHYSPQSDPSNPLHFTIAQEARYHVSKGSLARGPHSYQTKKTTPSTVNPFHTPQFMTTQRHFYPQIDAVSGKVLRSADKKAIRIPTSKPSIRSEWTEDLYIQLGGIADISIAQETTPERQAQTPFNHYYEAYYHFLEKDPRAYDQLFPESISATLEIWINPLTKFIWLGSILFFFSGLLVLLPIPKPRLDQLGL